jgi:hypothetical protein
MTHTHSLAVVRCSSSVRRPGPARVKLRQISGARLASGAHPFWNNLLVAMHVFIFSLGLFYNTVAPLPWCSRPHNAAHKIDSKSKVFLVSQKFNQQKIRLLIRHNTNLGQFASSTLIVSLKNM